MGFEQPAPNPRHCLQQDLSHQNRDRPSLLGGFLTMDQGTVYRDGAKLAPEMISTPRKSGSQKAPTRSPVSLVLFRGRRSSGSCRDERMCYS
jgi:hypothetical protein